MSKVELILGTEIAIECNKKPDIMIDVEERDGKYIMVLGNNSSTLKSYKNEDKQGPQSSHYSLEGLQFMIDLCEKYDGHLVITRNASYKIIPPSYPNEPI